MCVSVAGCLLWRRSAPTPQSNDPPHTHTPPHPQTTALGGQTVTATHSHEMVYMYPGKLRLRCPGDRPTVGLMEHKRRLMDVSELHALRASRGGAGVQCVCFLLMFLHTPFPPSPPPPISQHINHVYHKNKTGERRPPCRAVRLAHHALGASSSLSINPVSLYTCTCMQDGGCIHE